MPTLRTTHTALALILAATPLAAQPTHAPYLLPDGSIQIVAPASMAGIVKAIDTVFTATHPGARFTVLTGDNYSAMAALTFDRTVAAPLGCEFTRIGLGDNLKISAEPIGIRIAHATLTAGPAVPQLGVVVHPDNPLTSLTLAQLTRIFAVGAPSGDIATWSQAGVSGPLAPREIHPIGPLATDEQASADPQAGEFLSNHAFSGLLPNHRYTALPDYNAVLARVREDPAAIGIVALNLPLTGVKLLALQPASAQPVAPDAASIAAGAYPLDRFLFLYLRVPRGSPIDDFSREYIRTALSADAQRAIAADPPGYIPLSPTEAAEERSRLEGHP